MRGKGRRSRGNGSEESCRRESRLRLWTGVPGTQPRAPSSPPSSLLTAAKLVTVVKTVVLLITVEAGRDALVRGDTAELRGPAHVLGALGS